MVTKDFLRMRRLQSGAVTVVGFTAAGLDVYLGPAPPELSLPEVRYCLYCLSCMVLPGHDT